MEIDLDLLELRKWRVLLKVVGLVSFLLYHYMHNHCVQNDPGGKLQVKACKLIFVWDFLCSDMNHHLNQVQLALGDISN